MSESGEELYVLYGVLRSWFGGMAHRSPFVVSIALFVLFPAIWLALKSPNNNATPRIEGGRCWACAQTNSIKVRHSNLIAETPGTIWFWRPNNRERANDIKTTLILL